MRTKPTLLIFLLITFVVDSSFAQKIPFVYGFENTGAKYPTPVLPTIEQLPAIEPLTDPFAWFDWWGT
ncbi:MAG: hypothetical protein Q8K69_04695, partial [Bacteroidota bacterium]|nr:hypothetical protein [Bacteroidota bacterium]